MPKGIRWRHFFFRARGTSGQHACGIWIWGRTKWYSREKWCSSRISMAVERSGVIDVIFWIISIVEAIFNIALLLVCLLVSLLRRNCHCGKSIKQYVVLNTFRSCWLGGYYKDWSGMYGRPELAGRLVVKNDDRFLLSPGFRPNHSSTFLFGGPPNTLDISKTKLPSSLARAHTKRDISDSENIRLMGGGGEQTTTLGRHH